MTRRGSSPAVPWVANTIELAMLLTETPSVSAAWTAVLALSGSSCGIPVQPRRFSVAITLDTPRCRGSGLLFMGLKANGASWRRNDSVGGWLAGWKWRFPPGADGCG